MFQLESSGMKQMLTQIKPRTLEDIIAAIALYRPGPMDSIPKYIEARHDKSKIHYCTPLLAPILDVTYGCIVYQEQVMQISVRSRDIPSVMLMWCAALYQRKSRECSTEKSRRSSKELSRGG